MSRGGLSREYRIQLGHDGAWVWSVVGWDTIGKELGYKSGGMVRRIGVEGDAGCLSRGGILFGGLGHLVVAGWGVLFRWVCVLWVGLCDVGDSCWGVGGAME